jgi:DNA invertase Pin-like site-specific DNA recombinase
MARLAEICGQFLWTRRVSICGMKALAYIRRSGAPGNGSVSFDMQVRATRELAMRHGDELPEILSDMAVSGASTRRRPDYKRLLDAIDAGQVTTIYSFALSRLARSVIDFADLLERCRKHGVIVRLAQEGQIDYNTATGRGYANMAATFAQMEREIAAERIAAAVIERRERGDAMGQAAYGYKIADGQIVRRRDEKPEAVIAAFREAGTFGGTARLLNKLAIPTRHGKPWTHGVVSDVLRRIAPPDLALPLLRRRPGAPATGRAIFSGLLHCRCGALLTPRRDAANPTGVSGYYCSRSYRLTDHGRMATPEKPILEWAMTEAARLRMPAAQAEIEERDQLAATRIETRRARVIDTYVDGAISKHERDRRLRLLDEEAEKLAAETHLARIPQAIDWTWSPETLNGVLRAMWDSIELDDQLQPTRADWRVSEWRA